MRDNLGELEQLVLLAVLRLSGEAYGVAIRDEIRDRTGRSISPGTIYPTLDRLERKGYVSSAAGEPLPERGGRSRRIYEMRPEGLAALRASLRMLRALGSGFEATLHLPEES
jgi:DNA-binding PadR family transcriptional regulator